jgi:hypothetical protein
MFLAVQYFIPHRYSGTIYSTSLNWDIIIGIFAIILGIASLVHFHLNKIRRKDEAYQYSYVLLAGLAFMILAGAFGGAERNGIFLRWGYTGVLNPVSSTMFALLAFYIASAAFRAFRARTVVATILLVSAILVMLGRVPVGEAMIPGIAHVSDWLLNVPNMAAKRAIAIGLGLGGSATALKIVLGIEAPHLR